jgi:hypothetical protein
MRPPETARVACAVSQLPRRRRRADSGCMRPALRLKSAVTHRLSLRCANSALRSPRRAGQCGPGLCLAMLFVSRGRVVRLRRRRRRRRHRGRSRTSRGPHLASQASLRTVSRTCCCDSADFYSAGCRCGISTVASSTAEWPSAAMSMTSAGLASVMIDGPHSSDPLAGRTRAPLRRP